jgi:hypothetical protein
MEVGSKIRPCVENRVNVVILVKCVSLTETIDRWVFKGTFFLLYTSLLLKKICAGTVGFFFSINFFHKRLTSVKEYVPKFNINCPYNWSQHVPTYRNNLMEKLYAHSSATVYTMLVNVNTAVLTYTYILLCLLLLFVTILT